MIWLKGKSTSSPFFFLISHSQSSLIEVCCISVLFLRTLQLCLVMNTEVLIHDLLLIVLLVLLRANLPFSLTKMHPLLVLGLSLFYKPIDCCEKYGLTYVPFKTFTLCVQVSLYILVVKVIYGHLE